MTILDRKTAPPKSVIYRYRGLKYGLVLFFLAAIFALSVFTLVAVPSVLIKLLGLLLVPAVGLILWVQASFILLPGNLVTIDEHGIWDQRISAAPVPWRAIKRAYRKSSLLIASIEHVYLELADPSYCQQPRLAGIGRILGIPTRSAKLRLINPACLSGSAEEILAAIGSFRPDMITLPPDPLGPEAAVDPSEAAGHDDGAERYVVVRKRKHVAVILALSLAFMVLFAIFVVSGHRRQITAALLLGGATLTALWMLRELSTSKPTVIIDRNGITLREFGSRTVPWHQARDVKVSDWLIAVEEVKASDVPTPGLIGSFFSRTDPAIVAFALSAGTDEIRAAVAHFRAQALEESSSGR